MSRDAAEMQPSFGKHFIVAGNGPSLAQADPARLDLTSTIVRVNNFFFEPEYYVGRRVDLVQVGGDRWIFPFYAKTLRRVCREGMYDVKAWSTHQPHLSQKREMVREFRFVPLSYRDAQAQKAIGHLIASHGKTPTTGILAVINAHGLGAETITLLGIDLYNSPKRYAYDVGPRAAGVVNRVNGYNSRFHSLDLDRAVLDYLSSRGDVKLYRVCEGVHSLDHLPLAPLCQPSVEDRSKRFQVSDWEAWYGIWPLGMAKALRRAREMQIDLMGGRK